MCLFSSAILGPSLWHGRQGQEDCWKHWWTRTLSQTRWETRNNTQSCPLTSARMCEHIYIHIHTGTYKGAHKQKKRESPESLVNPKPSPSRATVRVTSQSSGELSVLCLWPPVKLCTETVWSLFHLRGFLTPCSTLIWPRAHEKASIPQDHKMEREYCSRLKEMRLKPERTSPWDGELITTNKYRIIRRPLWRDMGSKPFNTQGILWAMALVKSICLLQRILKPPLFLPVCDCAEKCAQKLTLTWKV